MLSACAGAAETLPSHSPLGKSFNLMQFSPCVWKIFRYKKGICLYLEIAPSNRNIFTCIVRRTLNAISDRNKTETLFALWVLGNRILLLRKAFSKIKIDPITFYKCRKTVIFGFSGEIRLVTIVLLHLPRPWLIRISQKPNLIIVLLYIVLKKIITSTSLQLT